MSTATLDTPTETPAPVLGGAAPAQTPPPAPAATPPAPAGDTPLPKGWHESILTPDGKFAEKWQDQLPDDFADDRAMLGRYSDLKSFVKAFKDNMTAARAKSEGLVKIPGQDATDEDRAAYYKAIGVPDDPKGYGIKPPEKLPDGVKWDDSLSEKFAGIAHQAGLTPAQVAKLTEWQVAQVAEQVGATRESAAQAMEAEKKELNRTFGADLPKAVDLAQRIAKQEGLSPDIADPQSPNFWGVEALALLSRVAAKLGEDRLIPGAAVRNLSGAALGKDIATNPENPLYAKYQAGDPGVASQVRALYAQG